MLNKFISTIMSFFIVILFSFKSYGQNNEYYYPGMDIPTLQPNRKILLEQMVDPAKSALLSLIYPGLGQLYSGKREKGILIMSIGTLSILGAFGLVLPRLSNRQESVTALGSSLVYILLFTAHIFNVKDAFNTAEEVNNEIREKLLLSIDNNVNIYYVLLKF
jgi:TM2 domain-containing membrane protein YozV